MKGILVEHATRGNEGVLLNCCYLLLKMLHVTVTKPEAKGLNPSSCNQSLPRICLAALTKTRARSLRIPYRRIASKRRESRDEARSFIRHPVNLPLLLGTIYFRNDDELADVRIDFKGGARLADNVLDKSFGPVSSF